NTTTTRIPKNAAPHTIPLTRPFSTGCSRISHLLHYISTTLIDVRRAHMLRTNSRPKLHARQTGDGIAGTISVATAVFKRSTPAPLLPFIVPMATNIPDYS